MDVSHLLVIFLSWMWFSFLIKQKNILVEDKFSPVFQHGFLRSEENVDLHNLSVSVGENVNLHKFQHCGVRCEVNLMQWQMFWALQLWTYGMPTIVADVTA